MARKTVLMSRFNEALQNPSMFHGVLSLPVITCFLLESLKTSDLSAS